ncbi:MAG: radical SAM family heme chaperone HemW [Acidobacteria bacterium]|nr:radical SAM family heme chaperone HemW [Acidobacteriota bacterium]
MVDPAPIGVYVHVPFCATRCSYCDFAIVTGHDERVAEYVAAVGAEIAEFAGRHGRRGADSVYLGGGTPSRVPPAELGRLMEHVQRGFAVEPGAEVSLEANPEDVTPDALAAWRGLGFERVTIGVQTLSEEGHRALGRPGSPAESLRAVADALAAGFPRVGIDLIFGWPGQTLAGWLEEVGRAAALGAGHLSCYALETTSRTALVRRVERGALPAPDPDLAADMYEAAVTVLQDTGLRRYEISNFARAGEESRHNLKYWTDGDYVGFGPAAASYVGGERWVRPRRFSEYLAAPPDRAGVDVEPYDADVRAGEAMMFGLRLATGVDLARIAARHGDESVQRREPALARAAAAGLLERTGTRARLTDRGLLVADELFVDLL